MKRQTLTQHLKTIWGAHHFVHGSKDVADIAAVINLSPEYVEKMMRSAYWDEALLYWGYIPPIGDLNIAQRLLSSSEQRHVVETLRKEYSVRQICQTLGFNKSTFYYQPKLDPSEDVLRA